MSINPLNDISKVYLEQVAAVEEGVRPTPVDKPLDKAAFKKRRRSLAGKEKSAEARARGHEGKEWYNSGRTYSPDEAKRMRSKLDDEERRTRHRSAVEPDNESDDSFSADKTKNPKKLRKQKAMGELGEASHLETDMKKRREANEKAVEDMKKTKAYKDMAAAARKKFDEALDPVGKEDADIDNDGDTDKSDKYLNKRRKAIGKAIATRKEALDPVGQEDDDIDNDGDTDKSDAYLKNRRKVRSAAIGKKKVSEGFSNWRQDLFEIISTEDEEEQKQIKEKKVKNNVKTCAMGDGIKISEAIETLGGHLVEMVEIEEDYVFEGVLDEVCDAEMFFLDNRTIHSVVEETILECIEDGYDPEYVIQSIIESIDTSLVMLMEEDDPKAARRSGILQKVKSAVKAVGKGLARGAGYAAGLAVRGAKAVGRETAAGYQRGRQGSGSSTTSSAPAGGREEDDKEEEEKDKKPGLLSRIGSKLKKGLKKAVAKGARAVSRGARNVARKMEGGQTQKTAATSTSAPSEKEEEDEKESSSEKESPSEKEEGRPAKRRKGGPSYAEVKAQIDKKEAAKKSKKGDKLDSLLSSIRNEEYIGEEKKVTKLPSTVNRRRKTSLSKTSSSGRPALGTHDPEKGSYVGKGDIAIGSGRMGTLNPVKSLGRGYKGDKDKVSSEYKKQVKADRKAAAKERSASGEDRISKLIKSVRKEEVQLDEKTLTKKEMSKREELVKSMKKKAGDFEKRYPGRGKEVMYATATKMAKKIAKS